MFGHDGPGAPRACVAGEKSVLNGITYFVLSWFGLIALIRSIVNQATIGPIVLFVGFMLLEECFRFLPARHYVAVLFGMFPSIAGESANVGGCHSEAVLTCHYNRGTIFRPNNF